MKKRIMLTILSAYSLCTAEDIYLSTGYVLENVLISSFSRGWVTVSMQERDREVSLENILYIDPSPYDSSKSSSIHLFSVDAIDPAIAVALADTASVGIVSNAPQELSDTTEESHSLSSFRKLTIVVNDVFSDTVRLQPMMFFYHSSHRWTPFLGKRMISELEFYQLISDTVHANAIRSKQYTTNIYKAAGIGSAILFGIFASKKLKSDDEKERWIGNASAAASLAGLVGAAYGFLGENKRAVPFREAFEQADRYNMTPR